jgi:O-acetyl-ADP-ribose deacetylase (regulator of RNase III)
MKSIDGDLIKLSKQGKFDVIIHGCNCFLTFGKGIALQVKREFPEAYQQDKNTVYGDIKKLGTFTSAYIKKYHIIVINAYTQYDYRGFQNKINVDYSAVKKCFTKIKEMHGDKRIGIPMIGAGLAGGDWNKIYNIINDLGFDDLTLVKYNTNN